MKKRKEIITLAVIAVSGILAAVLFFGGGQLPWRIYSGDRIKGTVCVYVDGEQYSISPDDVSGADKVKILDSGALEYCLKADEYGSYTIDLGKCGTDDDILLKYHQFNWWNVYRTDITLSINTAENTIVCEGHSTYLSERGLPEKKDEDRRIPSHMSPTTITLGTV